MKIKDQVPSDNIDDNPSGIKQWVGAKLMPHQVYKMDPPDAVQMTSQHSNHYEKRSNEMMQESARGKGNNKQSKGNRMKMPKGMGGGSGW